MVKKLSIKNFKSLKEIQLDCKKLNIFIGEPNSGKSNIIEALSFLSTGVMQDHLPKDVFRYKTMGDFFFDSNINKPIEVNTDVLALSLKFAMRADNAPDNQFEFTVVNKLQEEKPQSARFEHSGKMQGHLTLTTPFRLYQYKRLDSFTPGYANFLLSPHGANLVTLLLSNEDLRHWVEEFFASKGLMLTMKPVENDINISKLVKKSLYSYPYSSVSETLQRIVFYMLAIKSNKENMLLLDEPESNTFPFYTKFLAESIGLDQTNQFFITTHNPYLLLNLIEKSPEKDLSVFICQMKDHESKVTALNKKQIKEVLDFNSDVFFNLERILA